MKTLTIITEDSAPIEIDIKDSSVDAYLAGMTRTGFRGIAKNGNDLFIPIHQVIRVEIGDQEE